MTRTRPFVPEPATDELLSSFLVRTALRHGMNAYRFTSCQIPGVQFWTRDLDRSISDTSLDALAVVCGLDRSQVESMTLRRYERAYATSEADALACRQGVGAWINALGIYHSMRGQFGLQYCPECLRDTPVFIQQWRLAFVTVCPQHRRWLSDCCRHCGATVTPHRNRISQIRCYRCHALLNDGAVAQLPCNDFDIHCMIQTELLSFTPREFPLPGTSTMTDTLRGLHALMPALRRHRFSSRPKNDVILDPAGHSRIELARVSERAQSLLLQYRTLKNWPVNFRILAEETQLAQKAFLRRELLPTWLACEVDRLPPGKTRPTNRARSREPTPGKRAPHWRSQRAATLVKLAKSS